MAIDKTMVSGGPIANRKSGLPTSRDTSSLNDGGARDDAGVLNDGGAPSGDDAQSGFGRLAGRISRWTSNLLLSAMIVLVAVLFGSRLTQLWQPTHIPSQPDPLPFGFLDNRQTPLRLVFGNAHHVITRQTVMGSRAIALDRLADACAETTAAAALPDDEASSAEVALVKQIERTKPIRETVPGAEVYRLDATLPMVIGVRQTAVPGSDSPAPDGVISRRVVTWAVAAPGLESGWTIYLFSPHERAEAATSQGDRVAEVPPPPGADHLLSIGTADGAAVMAFRGDEGPEQWSQFYDDWFSQRQWQLVIPWRTAEQSWSARYRHTNDRGNETVDIQIRTGDATSETTIAGQTWRGVVTHSVGKTKP